MPIVAWLVSFSALCQSHLREKRERKSEMANYSPFIWIGLAFVAAVIEKSAAVICSARVQLILEQMLHSQHKHAELSTICVKCKYYTNKYICSCWYSKMQLQNILIESKSDWLFCAASQTQPDHHVGGGRRPALRGAGGGWADGGPRPPPGAYSPYRFVRLRGGWRWPATTASTPTTPRYVILYISQVYIIFENLALHWVTN